MLFLFKPNSLQSGQIYFNLSWGGPNSNTYIWRGVWGGVGGETCVELGTPTVRLAPMCRSDGPRRPTFHFLSLDLSSPTFSLLHLLFFSAQSQHFDRNACGPHPRVRVGGVGHNLPWSMINKLFNKSKVWLRFLHLWGHMPSSAHTIGNFFFSSSFSYYFNYWHLSWLICSVSSWEARAHGNG